MRSRKLFATIAAAAAVVLLGNLSLAAGEDAGKSAPKDAGAAAPKGDAGAPKTDAGANANDAGRASPTMNPLGDDDMDDPAAGDPHGPGAGGNPHGGAGGMDANGLFQAPPDTADIDPNLPPGSIRIHVVDADAKPIANQVVTIGIINNSIAKGESRKRVECTTDADGQCLLKDQDRGQLIAYRVSVTKDGASFAVPPFQLSADKGVRCVLHLYPVVNDLAGATIVSQAILYVELKDDRVQIEEILSVYNFGKTTWVPKDLLIELPETFTALTSQQEMSDVTVEPVEQKGARIRGTFGPGKHEIDFRWQVPYSGERDLTLFSGMPPHLAQGRVMAPSSTQLKLLVDGFPTAITRTDNQGQRILVTEREMRRDEAAVSRIKVELRDLPTAGPGRWIVSVIALVVMLGAIVMALVIDPNKGPRDLRVARKGLLEDLEDLERAHRRGDVGPKTYEREKRVLLERLAAVLRDHEPRAAS